MNRIILLSAAAIAGSWFTVSAQYEAYRFPQKTEEIQKIQRAGIESVTMYLDAGGPQVPYGIRFYDAQGRIVKNIDAKTHAWYWYDGQGRVERCVDSAFDGRRYFPSSFAFTYGPDGGLQSCQAGKSLMSFSYDPQQRQLSEIVNESAVRYYRFNEEGKMVEDVSGNAENPSRRKLTYNKYGDLATEITVTSTPSGRDSSISVYSFDSKGHLVRKQTNTFSETASEDPTAPANTTKQIQIWAYVYGMTGTLTSETKTSPTDPSGNSRTEWQYDPITLLPLKETRYDSQNKMERTLVYKYRMKR